MVLVECYQGGNVIGEGMLLGRECWGLSWTAPASRVSKYGPWPIFAPSLRPYIGPSPNPREEKPETIPTKRPAKALPWF